MSPNCHNGSIDRYYVYNDWSHDPPTQCDLNAIARERALHPNAQRLPSKLNRMLGDPALSGVIVWKPHGRSWQIEDRNEFRRIALPSYFQHSNVASFIRLVNAWGFRRVQAGVDYDSYYHELFLRGKPHLHVRMRRLTSCDRKDPLEISGQCPDFFNMPVCVGETHVSSCEDGAEAMEQRDMPLQTSTIIASTSGSTDLSFSQRSDYKTTGNENHQEARIIESQGASPAQFLRDTPNQIQQPILCCQRSFLDSTEWTNPHSVPCAMPKNLGSFFHGEQLEQMTPSNQVQYQTILSRHRINTDPNRNNPSFLQQEACPLYFTLLDSSLLASTTTNTSRRSRSQDRLIGYLANTLYPRVQTVGPPRNNEELIQLLISEWQASPDTGQGDDYQRLQRILANRRFRATNAFDEHI